MLLLCSSLFTTLYLTAKPSFAQADNNTAVENTNVAIVQRFYDDYAAGNADIILSTHAETVTIHYAGAADRVPAQVLRDDLAALKAANPDLYAEIHTIFAQGDLVVTELTWTTTHIGDYFGIPATGKTSSHPGIVVRRLADGKIVESWEMFDDLAFLHSLGYLHTWDEIVAQGPIPAPAAAAPTAELPPLAPGETVITSNAELAASLWRGRGGNPDDPPQTIWRFDAAGSYRVAFEVEQFAEGYFIEAGKYSFEGNQLILTATSRGCAAIPEEAVGRYEARITLQGGKASRIRLLPLTESCADRQRALTGFLPAVQP